MNIFNTKYSAKLFVNIKSKDQLLKVFKNRLSKRSLKPLILSYIYIGSLYFALVDKTYLKSLKEADLVVSDGFSIAWVLRLFEKKVERIRPEHYLKDLLDFCAENQKRVYILGGAKRAVENVKKSFPGVKISGLAGQIDESDDALGRINHFKPDLLLVALGLNKQEKWIYLNRNSLKGVKVIIPIGFYGEVLGGDVSLPPKILDSLKIRWIYRLLKEPKRLWKRYILGFSVLTVFIVYTVFLNLFRSIWDKKS